MFKGEAEGIVIRPLRATDILSFIKLRKEIEAETRYSPAHGGERRETLLYTILKMLWHLRRTTTLLAFRDGKLAGYILVIFGRYRKFRGNAYIGNVSVKSTERSYGIGTKLMNEAERQARERHARRIELEVFGSNTNAISIYEKMGYEKEGLKRAAIEMSGGKFDDMVLMAKFL
jgi:ribosomal protein S18 acetylase RimI-like enzyme